LHLNSVDCRRAYDREVTPGPTGSLHHVALRCSGFEELRARLRQRGLDHKINDVTAIGLKQIFVLDPNGGLLELNFFCGWPLFFLPCLWRRRVCWRPVQAAILIRTRYSSAWISKTRCATSADGSWHWLSSSPAPKPL